MGTGLRIANGNRFEVSPQTCIAGILIHSTLENERVEA